MQNVELGRPRSHSVHLAERMSEIDVPGVSLSYGGEDASAALGQKKTPDVEWNSNLPFGTL